MTIPLTSALFLSIFLFLSAHLSLLSFWRSYFSSKVWLVRLSMQIYCTLSSLIKSTLSKFCANSCAWENIRIICIVCIYAYDLLRLTKSTRAENTTNNCAEFSNLKIGSQDSAHTITSLCQAKAQIHMDRLRFDTKRVNLFLQLKCYAISTLFSSMIFSACVRRIMRMKRIFSKIKTTSSNTSLLSLKNLNVFSVDFWFSLTQTEWCLKPEWWFESLESETRSI